MVQKGAFVSKKFSVTLKWYEGFGTEPSFLAVCSICSCLCATVKAATSCCAPFVHIWRTEAPTAVHCSRPLRTALIRANWWWVDQPSHAHSTFTLHLCVEMAECVCVCRTQASQAWLMPTKSSVEQIQDFYCNLLLLNFTEVGDKTHTHTSCITIHSF